MGGSGSHNDLVHSRGSPQDYDNWAAITGDPSWSYANVLKYFKMTEDFIGVTYGPDSDDGELDGLDIGLKLLQLLEIMR